MRLLRFLTFILLITLPFQKTLADEIHDLVKAGDIEAVKSLLALDPSKVRARDASQNTPLHMAAQNGFSDMVRLLLEGGAEVNAQNFRDRTPLRLAARFNEAPEVSKILIDHGADLNISDFLNLSPLSVATREGKIEIVDLLLAHGPELPDTTAGQKELMYDGTVGGVPRVFHLMREMGAPIEITNEDGGDLLRAAVEGASVEILSALLEMGVNPNWEDKYHNAPIHMAAKKGNIPVMKVLIGRGADIDNRTLRGKSAYNFAVEGEHQALMDYLVSAGADQSDPQFPEVRGPYLGQTPPGKEPELFAFGIMSPSGSQGIHSTPVFSKDGTEVYWSAGWRAPISYMIQKEGLWTIPKDVPFTSGDGDDAPFFSADESRLYFLSLRSFKGKPVTREEHLWYVEREEEGWSSAKPGPDAINSLNLHWQFAIGPDDTFYLPTIYEGGFGKKDIVVSFFQDGQYQPPENIGPAINTEENEYMPFVSVDNNYMIFSGRDRPDSKGGFDLYVSFRDAEGSWMSPQPLGPSINTGQSEICPIVSPDGKHLFFIRGGEIYWVSTSVIERLRP